MLTKKESVLLYLLFISQTLGRSIEPFGVLLWLLLMRQFVPLFRSLFKVGFLLLYLVLVSLIGYAITSFPLNHFVEQILQLGYYLGAYYSLMVYFKGRYEDVFNVYVNVALFLSTCGIVQYILGRFFGIPFLFSVSGREVVVGELLRARAWMGEASYMALYIIPAIVYHSLNHGVENLKSIVMIVAGLLTFSPIFQILMVAFFVYYVIHIKLNPRRVFIYGFAFIAVFYLSSHFEFSSYNDDDLKRNETLQYLNADFSELEQANLSTYSLLKNFKIARMADNRITGTGLGSHGYSHDKYYHSSFQYSDLNKEDAFSLGTRLYSELGIVGIILFLLFIIKGINPKNQINVACIFYIVYAFCRGGHYTIFGAQFFFMLFFFTSRYKITKSQEL